MFFDNLDIAKLEQVEEELTTRTVFPTLFSGSELVVAGKLKKQASQDSIVGHVSGSTLGGNSVFSSSGVEKASSLERLWAYLTIQQLLEEHDLQTEDGNNSTEGNSYKKKALQLALKVRNQSSFAIFYLFVLVIMILI